MTLLDPRLDPWLGPCSNEQPAPGAPRRTPTWLPVSGALLLLGIVLYGYTELLRIGGADSLLGEAGPVELAQVAALVASTTLLLFGARCPEMRPLYLPMAAVLAAATLRELDGPLDRIAHGVWKYPAWALALGGLWSAIRLRCELPRPLALLSASRAGGLLAGSAFVVLIQSRLLGRQDVWRAALGSDYVRDVPRLVEELSELAGYGLLLIACIELHRVARLNMCPIARKEAGLPPPRGERTPR